MVNVVKSRFSFLASSFFLMQPLPSSAIVLKNSLFSRTLRRASGVAATVAVQTSVFFSGLPLHPGLGNTLPKIREKMYFQERYIARQVTYLIYPKLPLIIWRNSMLLSVLEVFL